jgi:RNA polymerase sigma-70 factor, ECF subfamily
LELFVPDAEISARQTAFVGVFSREERRLFGVALSILRDAHEAEDAVQETAALAWRAWDDARSQDQPGPWLTRICVNECLRWRRRHLRWRLASSDDAPDLSSEHLAFDERAADLDRAHSRLSHRQRAVVVLHYHHGYSLEECAELMHCRPGTAASHLHRALRTLRREVGDD